MNYKELENMAIQQLLTPKPGYTPRIQDETYKILMKSVVHAVVVTLKEYDRMKQRPSED